MLDAASLNEFLMRKTTRHDLGYYELKAKPAREKLMTKRFCDILPERVASAAFLFVHATDAKSFKSSLLMLSEERVADLDLLLNWLLLGEE